MRVFLGVVGCALFSARWLNRPGAQPTLRS
jgi:hypothetical protein